MRLNPRYSKQQAGYILPATILLGLATAILSVVLLQVTATASQTINNISYKSIAKQAAVAGTTYADSCVQGGVVTWTSLTPLTDCSGNAAGGSSYITNNGDWRSSFSVSAPTISNNKLTAVSTGKVELLYGTTVVQSYTATSKVTLPSTITSLPVATGTPITEIRNDQTDCAIANGKLYCWGNNDYGQLGRGYTGYSSANATPTLVGGAIAGKTVTRVSVAYQNVCVIADGAPYCWGDNGAGQLGNGTKTAVNIPTAGIPTTSSGPLSGQFTTDIGVSSENNPANLIWPFATAFSHSTALTADGSVSSWGDGGFRQNTGGDCARVFGICTGWYNYPSYTSPNLIVSYAGSGGLISGQKSERVGASSHDGCALSQGQLICWGVPAPLPVICYVPPVGQFSEAYETIIPYNGCVATFSNEYNASTLSGSSLSGKFIDPALWDVSSNEGCWMANFDFVCFGTTPAFDLFWSGAVIGDAWGAPWTMASNVDVTDADNGDSVPSWGTTGLFCIVDRGVGECAGNPLNIYTGTGTLGGYKNLYSLITSSGLSGLTATKIAAGQNHGCVIANGELFCWGDGSYGALADGNTNSHLVSYPTLSANSTIGTTSGTYVADGPISSGGNFSCGTVNGHLYCWGSNSSGQLGMGNNTDVIVPQAVPNLLTKVVTKVSAGTNHACAIAAGLLYCWGDNTYGQLGIGSTGGSQNAPQQIGGAIAGKRVTDVSAGVNSTCAIANGQAYCWGSNSNGQLGIGSTTSNNSPAIVNGHGSLSTSTDTTRISVGDSFACAIGNADAYCWGKNSNSQVGDQSTTQRTSPVLLTKGTAGSPTGPNGTRPLVSDISAGSDFACGIFNGTVSCWGDNANGRTGLGTTSGNTNIPTNISGSAGSYYATNVSAGTAHTCAIIDGNSSATNGNLFCWGMGANGRLGNGGTSDVSTATVITGGNMAGKSTTGISAGDTSTCSVSNGDILCWGNGSSGKLGNGGTADKTTPTITSSYVQLGAYTKGIIY